MSDFPPLRRNLKLVLPGIFKDKKNLEYFNRTLAEGFSKPIRRKLKPIKW